VLSPALLAVLGAGQRGELVIGTRSSAWAQDGDRSCARRKPKRRSMRTAHALSHSLAGAIGHHHHHYRSGAAPSGSTASFGSAGINRHRERNERVRHRRSSAPRWPWAMRRRPRGRRRSVGQGYLQAGLLSREISVSGCRRCPNERKATSLAASMREPSADPARSENHCMQGISMHENREIPHSPVALITGRAAQGRLRPHA
jgi:hypothetical protein